MLQLSPKRDCTISDSVSPEAMASLKYALDLFALPTSELLKIDAASLEARRRSGWRSGVWFVV
jgi:hypothetical protein